MYNVILVDDDYPVLEFLHTKIPWNDLGFEVTFLAQDGEQALHYIRQKCPDVIITDIGMPIINGIELISNVKNLNPTVHSIFLTCHDDFNYAQQALRLNSFDYILKESIDSDNIIALLKRLKEKLDSEEDNKHELTNMKFLIKENWIVLRSRLIDMLLEENYDGVANWWDKQKKELELDVSFDKCIPTICFIDNFAEHHLRFDSNDQLKITLDNVIMEILSKSRKGFSIFYKDSKLFIFHTIDPNNENLNEVLQNSLLEINRNLEKYLNISMTAVIGEVCEFPIGLTSQLKQLIASENQRFYMKHGSIAKKETQHFTSENIFLHSMDASQEFKLLIIQEDKNELEKSINKWMLFIKEKNYNPKATKEWALHTLLDVERMINSMKNFESNSSDSMTNHLILNAETIEQLEKLLMDGFCQILSSFEYLTNQSQRNEIFKAQKYVLLNLDKKISLVEIAEYLYLNPSYFSRLYKKSTNENFIDYVNRIKMERAKELITNTNEPIEQIAYMLGFESKSYFLKRFKKHFGISPKHCKIDSRKVL